MFRTKNLTKSIMTVAGIATVLGGLALNSAEARVNSYNNKLKPRSTITKNSIVCKDSESMQEYIVIENNTDFKAMSYYEKNKGCRRLSEETEFSYLDVVNDNNAWSPHKVLIYPKNSNPRTAWTAGYYIVNGVTYN